MGARHTTLASLNATIGEENFSREILESDPQLSALYDVDRYLFPGSGRMMRTFRLKHKTNGSTVVVKLMWVTQEEEETQDLALRVQSQQEELSRIQHSLQDEPHMAPFLYWHVGPYRPKFNMNVRPTILLRPHFYTTLSDRLASRPFLTHVEKLWIVYQLLQALDCMHSKQIVHGFLTTENIGLSSWNWVVLMDIASYKARTALPDNDPSEYLYFFQELNQQGSDSTPREKRCYLAPERFYTPNDRSQNRNNHPGGGMGGDSSVAGSAEGDAAETSDGGHPLQSPLTPAMDIFSAGCVIMETFLNGERAFDLGDLMDYRKRKASQTMQQKLNKIEFSALRAACRHMLSLDPTQRLSARAYLERLEVSELVPKSFLPLAELVKEVTNNKTLAPDARLAKAAAYYTVVIYETMGIDDVDGRAYFTKALGNKTATQMNIESDSMPTPDQPSVSSPTTPEEKKESDQDILLAETEALLRKIEALSFDEDEVMNIAAQEERYLSEINSTGLQVTSKPKVKRSQMSQSSLLVYLQLILSTVRHVHRPASKLVALQLMDRVGKYSTDEARLQRIVPVTVSLLQDQDPLVRSSAIQVLTATISIVETFPPSDSKVFPQYIFKRVAHLVTDPSLVVRLAFARSVAVLAETAHRFLDVSHAVRLYEAVGGGGSSSASTGENQQEAPLNTVFGDDVAKLLDETSGGSHGNSKSLKKIISSVESTASDIAGAGKTLISSTYNSELGALHETISRWVVHITTDFSEHSSPAKRALLSDMARLCNFFGLDGVMAFILPQVLSFLNDRKDWQLRATLFDHLQSVCQFIGRAATEHFVLPILETALVDSEEVVISRALQCLSELLRMGLLSRAVLLGSVGSQFSEEQPGFLKKYGALLLHPSSDVRFHAIATVNALSESIGQLDAEVFVVPIIRPYIRFQPSSQNLFTQDGLQKCLCPPWTRQKFQKELALLIVATDSALSPTAGQWTSIAFQVKSTGYSNPGYDEDASKSNESTMHDRASKKESVSDEQTVQFRSYLQMLARSRNYAMKIKSTDENGKPDMSHSIEGSLKLAQHIKFPRQDALGSPPGTLPSWYGTLRESQEANACSVCETAAIRSVSALGQVYGLSIMDHTAASTAAETLTAGRVSNILQSDESRSIEAACAGEWGSETCLDPTLSDTSLLLTKLKALQVPPLPPRLGEERYPNTRPSQPPRQHPKESGDPRDSQIWKPKIDTVIATSRRAPDVGHTAPVVRLGVSNDQRFFVSGSHDGTCRIWESEKAEKSNGVLESSSTYSMHNNGEYPPRVNDLVMVEGGHSVASGGSDGSVHVWRVDLVSSSSSNLVDSSRDMRRVAGATEIRRMNLSEGEVLAVNQFNTPAASLITFATQSGYIHSWDLRSHREPWCLKNCQDIGYITSMAMGSDRHWAVIGTNRGFVALWDIRFQQQMKMWHHSRSSPINRLATSFVPPPQSWIGRGSSNALSKPYLFAACGPNECAMFDATSGTCSECFRTIEYGSRSPGGRLEGLPHLSEVPLSTSARRKALLSQGIGSARLGDIVSSSFRSVNAMVGSIGASDGSFFITGGSDCRIRFWDFSMPSKCYVTSGIEPVQPRPNFERIDYTDSSRLMLCRQAPAPALNEVDSSRVPRKLFQGTRAIHQGHHDSIQDLKVIKNGLISCSRDCTVKLWR